MINRKYLPSKRFLTALYIAGAIVVVAIIFSYWKSSTAKEKNNNLIAGANATSTFSTVDSDNDGLVDWKENLYGTDPKKADTDNDGTSDFDEISQNRDSLKPNTAPKGQEPNDKMDPAIIERDQKIMEEYEKLNETDRFARDLVSNFVASQPVNGSMDENTVNSIVEKAASELPQKNYGGITKMSDLNLQKTDNTNLSKNMTNYASNFYRETQKLVILFGLDMNVINSYVENGDAVSKSRILDLADKYQEIINNLIKMPVPVAIGYYDINDHLRVINDLEIIAAIDRDIANSDKDSLGIFPNLSVYSNVILDLFPTLTKIDTILKIKR